MITRAQVENFIMVVFLAVAVYSIYQITQIELIF
jgi:hypothetical protein